MNTCITSPHNRLLSSAKRLSRLLLSSTALPPTMASFSLPVSVSSRATRCPAYKWETKLHRVLQVTSHQWVIQGKHCSLRLTLKSSSHGTRAWYELFHRQTYGAVSAWDHCRQWHQDPFPHVRLEEASHASTNGYFLLRSKCMKRRRKRSEEEEEEQYRNIGGTKRRMPWEKATVQG